jgi:hypothetical protein
VNINRELIKSFYDGLDERSQASLDKAAGNMAYPLDRSIQDRIKTKTAGEKYGKSYFHDNYSYRGHQGTS